MITKLGQRGYAVHDDHGEYRTGEIDPDTDPDPERSPLSKCQSPLHALTVARTHVPIQCGRGGDAVAPRETGEPFETGCGAGGTG